MSALSSAARHEYYLEMGNALPTALTGSESRHELRFNTAIEAFEALRPGDAYEGRLAVRIVLCGAYAVEHLRKANLYRDEFTKETRYCAQAASFMREERAARRMLMQEQKVRLATEAVAKTAPAQPAAAAVPPPSTMTPAAPPLPVEAALPQWDVTAAVPPSALPQTVQAAAAPAPSPEAIAQAETFALENSAAAAQIRLDRGVTSRNKACYRNVTMPADPAVIDALVRGTSEALTMLDDLFDEELDAAD